MENIRFEQAVLLHQEKDKIKIYEERYNQILRQFTKSPFLQLKAWGLWEKILELSEPVSESDWSKYLFGKLEIVFSEYENLQNDPNVSRLKDDIINMIKYINEHKII